MKNFIKEHIEYLKDNPEGYWFKRKLYGYGWTPAKLMGWVTLSLYVGIIGLYAWYITRIGAELSMKHLSFMGLVTILFLVIIYRTGESPKWQWGNKDEIDNEKK